MALSTALFSAVSGLTNHQTMLDVIGNNVANVNTIGYKGQRITFSDTFSQFIQTGTNPTETTGGSNSLQVGLGMKVNSIDRDWTQGTSESTGIGTDLALQGKAMFVLKDNGQTYYTRSGAFSFDANGNLVSGQNGAIVQGKIANSDGVVPPGNNLNNIQINTNMKLPAIATSNISWGGNLKAGSVNTRSENITFKGNVNSTAAIGSTIVKNVTLYNDFGDPFTLTATYTKTAAADETATPPTFGVYSLDYDIKDDTDTSILSAPPATITGLTFVDDGEGNIVLDAVSQTASKFTVDGLSDPVLSTLGLGFTVDASSLTLNSTSNTASLSADNNRVPNIVSGSVTVYDSLGTSHEVTLKFTKTAESTWLYKVSVPGTSTSSGKSEAFDGSITFSGDGTIETIDPQNPLFSFDPSGGANTLEIALDFGSAFSGVTQTSASSVVSSLSQNGSATASLSNTNIDQYGNIVGVFSNGSSRILAQIMVATFANQNGLTSIGENMYTSYANSGDAIVSSLGEQSNSTVQSGALEGSNVDLSAEFSKMIIAQRGYQANARVITTADTLLQEVTNLVR